MKPYQFFVRALDEIYAGAEKRKIKTPEEISRGEFANFSYQIDAIKQGLDCLEKYDGVIVADVVGLGKSVIAATVAYNLASPRTAVITPPHLKKQWERYVEKFQLQNAKVVSSGKIEELYRTAKTAGETLYIIDEAHRYRNENTAAYRMLHQIVRANPKNKVMLLTATPYNNHPRDVYALLKLFQIPSRATLNVVDNLSLRFGQLIAKYNQLEKRAKKKMTPEIEEQMGALAERLRMIIEPVVIRRSRLDLMEVKNYAEDLERQKISFAKVSDPELISYSLGRLTELYYRTLEGLSVGEFGGAKYKPLTYLADEAEFNAEYEKIFSFNRTQQLNMAKLARRLFVLRFESSQYAFKKTLENMIAAHRATIELWQKKGLVAISKSKTLDKLDGVEDDNFTIPAKLLKTEFLEDVEADLAWLEKVYHSWFANGIEFDPKQERVELTVRELLREKPERKIVIFTSFADTAQEIARKLRESGLARTLLYTSTGNQALKETVTRNFDATLAKDEREDQYDIIVATDALSEGFNLHRAGAIINYDVPYNPTRVVQRIGRINRINQRMFDELKIYNMFPTAIGEDVVNVKGISSLKMLLMNQVIGNDTKVLTQDEDVESFFRRQHQTADKRERASWDNRYRNVYDEAKNNTKLISAVRAIPKGARIVRKSKAAEMTSVALVRRGRNVLFMKMCEDEVKIITPEKALRIICAKEDENSIADDEDNRQKFRNELAKPYELPKMLGNRGYALDVIEALRETCEDEKKFLGKLHNAVRKYDDLCEAELQIITHLNLNNVQKAVEKLQTEIPEWYLDAIQEKAAQIEAACSEVIFVEDFK